MSESTPRQKVIALVLSGIYPGLGQFYNREPVKGAAFVVASIVLSWLSARALPGDLLTLDRLSGEALASISFGTDLLVSLMLLLGVWIWSLVDAWRVAAR